MGKAISRTAFLAIALLGLSSIAPIASADDVTWTLTDVIFGDGGTASGSFVYDADTNTVTSIDIVTTLGTAFGGATYTAVDPGYSSADDYIVFVTGSSGDYTDTPVLALAFDSGLTDAGGTVPLVLDLDSGEGTCSDTTCSSAVELRAVSGGDVVGTTGATVPEPASSGLLLIGVGMLGLVGLAKRKILWA